MMSISFINNFLLVIFVLLVLMGFYVWKSNKKKPLNQAFAIFTFIASIWILLNYLWGFFQTSKIILTGTYVISPFIITSMFVWVNYFFKDNITKLLKKLIIASAIGDILIALIGIFVDNSIVTSVESRFEFTTSPYFSVFAIYFIILILSFAIFFYLHYKRSDIKLKKSLNVIALGMILTLAIASIVSFILPSMGYVSLAVFDAPSIIFFVVFSAYAVLKMQLFDIRVIATEIMTYFILILSFVVLFIVKEDVNIFVKIILMGIFIYGGNLLVRSVQKEMSQNQELHDLADELKLANKRLQSLDKMKTEFVSIASHEMLTPISAIEGYLSMIIDEKVAEVKDPKALLYIQRVYESSKRLSRLVTDLLNVSRIEESRLLITKSEFDVKQMIDETYDEISLKAQEANISLEKYFEEGSASTVFADSDKIKEVMINIAGNAVKYTPEGGHVKIGFHLADTKSVIERFNKMENISEKSDGEDSAFDGNVDERLKTLYGDKQLIVFVDDDGIGLNKNDLHRLFKKFSRVGEWSTRQVQGTGLGLYIAKSLVEMNHGRIWAESKGENQGSHFFFSLPLSSSTQEIQKIEKDIKFSKDAKPLA